MSETGFGKEAWVAMFREIGLSDDQMHRWHAAFESRHPEQHREFLEWLRIPSAEVDRIREASRGAASQG
jgi:hypothetical protein